MEVNVENFLPQKLPAIWYLCFVPLHWLVIVKFMHFVNNTQYPVQPVPCVTECNACMQSGWDSVQINSNVQLNV